MRRHALRSRVTRKKFSNVFRNVFHVDAYRLKNARALAALGFDDVLADPKNIVLIEWAERAEDILPKDAAWLAFRHGKKENERLIDHKT